MSSSSTAAVAKRLERPGVPLSSKLFQSPAQRTLLLCLLLSAVVLVVYNPVIHNGFLNFDDDGYITANSHVKAGLTWAENGDLPEAIRQYSRAIAAEPTDVGYSLLAQALQRAGHADEANAISERLAHSTNLPEAQKTAESHVSGK
jgi:hypothetical protein